MKGGVDVVSGCWEAGANVEIGGWAAGNVRRKVDRQVGSKKKREEGRKEERTEAKQTDR